MIYILQVYLIFDIYDILLKKISNNLKKNYYKYKMMKLIIGFVMMKWKN